MKSVKSLLAALAFVFGVGIAFAMPEADENTRIFARVADPITGQTIEWVEVTGQEVGLDYDCDLQVQEVCTAQLVNDDPALAQPIPGTISEGRYMP